MLTCYRGHIISPASAGKWIEFRQGAMVVSEGKILDIGDWQDIQSSLSANDKVIDYDKNLIVPGLIDLHVHLVQMAAAGKWGVTLLDWLNDYIFPAEIKFKKHDHAKRLAKWFFLELAKNGTTLACVLNTIHQEATDIAFESAQSMGNRVIMGQNLMDVNSPDELTVPCNEALKQTEELCKKWHGADNNRILYAFTPRFAPTCSMQLLSGAADLKLKYPGTYIHTHLAENLAELELVKKIFPQNRSYVDVYKSAGLLGKNSLFAHSIYLDEKDILELSQSGSAIAHCPSSNFFLKSGVFPIERINKANIAVGLGSDIAAGVELSIFKAMKDAVYIQPSQWISPKECFYFATLGAARAVNLDHLIGSLEHGKDADFIVLDPALKSSITDDLLDHQLDDILSGLVYLGDDRIVSATYVRGKCIYEQEKFETLQKTDYFSKAELRRH